MKQQTTGCGRLFALAAFTASIWAVAETVSAAPVIHAIRSAQVGRIITARSWPRIAEMRIATRPMATHRTIFLAMAFPRTFVLQPDSADSA